MEAIGNIYSPIAWRIFIPQSPGCRQGTSLAPVTLAPGVHRSRRARRVTAVTTGTAGPTGRSSTADTTCIATGAKAGQQRAAQTDARAARGGAIATSVAQVSVSERLRRGERWRPGPLARRLSGERTATVVTAGTEPVTAGARPLVTTVTAPVTAPPQLARCRSQRSRRRRAGSGPGFRGGVGRRGSGLHQGGQAGQNQQGKQNEPLVLLGFLSCSFKAAGFVAPLHVAKRRSRVRARAGWHFRVLPWTDCRPWADRADLPCPFGPRQ